LFTVRGAQPILVNNVIRDNDGVAISINVNALNSELVVDSGRQTGYINPNQTNSGADPISPNRVSGQYDNNGPLILGNRMVGNDINGVDVRGGIVTTEVVFDDTDIAHVLQELIQELMQSDSYIRQQTTWIAQCTPNPRLRNALMLATVEEYCLRPIRNQPLLVYRFVNYLRRSQRGGMTQVPTGDLVRLVSEEITPDEADNPVSLLDTQAIAQYHDEQAWEEQQTLRTSVKDEFVTYLEREVDPVAARWLELHLQGQSQDAIAQTLNLPIKQVYRLREKISYHAIRVFSLKQHSELVTTWLGTSLRDHSLGLTPEQWQRFWESLPPDQQQLIEKLKSGKTIESIAQDLNVKTNQIMGEWSKLYLAAQALRSAS